MSDTAAIPAGTIEPSPELQAEARRLLNELGSKRAAERLGVDASSVWRMAAGLGIRRGTESLARAALVTAKASSQAPGEKALP